MIKTLSENTIVVTPSHPNGRLIQSDETDLIFQYGREQVLRPRDIKSLVIKQLFIDELLTVVKGIVEFDYKGTHYKFEPKKM